MRTSSNVASLLPASVTKETSDAGLPGPRLRAFSVTSHDDVGDPDALCFLPFASQVRLSFHGVSGWVRVCARVYLKRTAVSDLHFWRTELPAWRLSVRRECSEGKLLKNKGSRMTFPTICVFLLWNLDKTALEGEVSYRL